MLADAVCASPRRRLGTGYTTATPDTLQRRFLHTGGTIINHRDRVTSGSTGAPTRPYSAQPTSPTPPFHPITGKLDIVTLEPQSSTDRIAQRLIVVDHDYLGRHLATLLVTVARKTHSTAPS